MSDPLNTPNLLGGGQDVPLAIGIAGQPITGDPKQNHVAFIYHHIDGGYRLAHLAWHHLFKHEPWDGMYHWLDFPGVGNETLEDFAEWLVMIASQAIETPIPYSVLFDPKATVFDHQGRYVNAGEGNGLTCATFVLAALADFGLQIADHATWPMNRESDRGWLNKILKMLSDYLERRHPKMMTHAVMQANQRDRLRRYRPEEVVACANRYSGSPVKFADIEAFAIEIDAQIKRGQAGVKR